jgi:hypothetical protein
MLNFYEKIRIIMGQSITTQWLISIKDTSLAKSTPCCCGCKHFFLRADAFFSEGSATSSLEIIHLTMSSPTGTKETVACWGKVDTEAFQEYVNKGYIDINNCKATSKPIKSTPSASALPQGANSTSLTTTGMSLLIFVERES